MKTISGNEPQSEENVTNRIRSMDCESDVESDGLTDFVMLSTNKNPVNDIEDDCSDHTYENAINMLGKCNGVQDILKEKNG